MKKSSTTIICASIIVLGLLYLASILYKYDKFMGEIMQDVQNSSVFFSNYEKSQDSINSDSADESAVMSYMKTCVYKNWTTDPTDKTMKDANKEASLAFNAQLNPFSDYHYKPSTNQDLQNYLNEAKNKCVKEILSLKQITSNNHLNITLNKLGY